MVNGPNSGAGSAPGYVLKFDSDGNYLGKIDGAESDSGLFKSIGWNGSVSVDENGFVWVTAGPISKYSNDAENEYVLGSEWKFNGYGPAFSIRANGPGTRLLVGGTAEPDTPQIFSAGGSVVVGHLPCGGYFAGGIAYAPDTENFLVGNGGEVCEFTQKGVLLSRFGGGIQSSVGGIDVYGTTGDIYVADFNQNKINVYIHRIVPDVTTGDATGVGHTTATLTGQAAPDPAGGGDVTDCHFEVGTDTSYGTNVPCEQATPYSGSTAVTADLTGLTMETTYHYRLVAGNSIDSNPGVDRTFTPHAVIGLTTQAPTDLTSTSATLNGSFDPANDGTHYFFEWGPDTSYGNTTPAPPGADAGSAPGTKNVSAGIDGLSSYTAYHYRIVAVNSLGTSHGEDETFRTAPPEAPTVSGMSVTDVARDRATIHAVVNPDFGTTYYTLEYGTNGLFDKEIPGSAPLDPDDTDRSLTFPLSGLQPGTTYQARVVAVNFGGTTQGQTVSFTTLDVPTIESVEASGVTQTGATIAALINPKLSPTTFHVEYGPTAAYGSATRESAPIGADGVSHGVTVPLSGLTPGTDYHFRIVAVNELGTTATADRVFTTPPSQPGTLAAPEQTKCKPRFVKRKGRCVKRPARKRGKSQQEPKDRKARRPPVRGSRIGRALVAFCAAAACMAVGSSAALADTTHVFERYIDIPGAEEVQPVDADAQGNLLVWRNDTNDLIKVDPNGNPVNFSALGTNVLDGAGSFDCPKTPSDCDQMQTTNGFQNGTNSGDVRNIVGVDHSGGPASGYIYITNNYRDLDGREQGETVVFAPSGKYLGKLDETQPFPAQWYLTDEFRGGVSVGSDGAVYVVAAHRLSRTHVDRYVPVDGDPAHTQFSGQIRAACANSICIAQAAAFSHRSRRCPLLLRQGRRHHTRRPPSPS